MTEKRLCDVANGIPAHQGGLTPLTRLTRLRTTHPDTWGALIFLCNKTLVPLLHAIWGPVFGDRFPRRVRAAILRAMDDENLGIPELLDFESADARAFLQREYDKMQDVKDEAASRRAVIAHRAKRKLKTVDAVN